MTDEKEVTGLILAGGKGRRVKGHDKGLLSWRGTKLIDHVAGRIGPQVDQLIVSCNSHLAEYRHIGDCQVEDRRKA